MGRFVENSLKGAAAGFFIGLVMFKKRIPSTAYFAGLGAGWSYIECERKFNIINQTLN